MPNTQLLDAMATIREAAHHMADDDRFTFVFEEYRALEGKDIDYWAEQVRIQLERPDHVIPEPLRQIYEATGGFRFQWLYLPGSKNSVSGSAQVATLMEIYQRDEESEVPLVELYRHARPFDMIGGDELIGLEFPSGPDGEVSLVHLDEGKGTTARLSLDPVQYIVRLAEFRAIYGWQAAFVSDGPPDRAVTERLGSQVARIFGSGAPA